MNDFSGFLLYYSKLLILDRERLDILYDAHQDEMNGNSFCSKFFEYRLPP
jgi:hypothetical protein